MSLITFIVPSINRPTLGNTIQSLLNQTNKNWECFVLYDGVDDKGFSQKAHCQGKKKETITYENCGLCSSLSS